MNVIRVLGRIIGVLIVVTAVAALAIVVHGYLLAERPVHRRVPDFHAATDSTSIARGRHLAEVSCAGCHSPQGLVPLTGSRENFLQLDSTKTLGVLWPPNLTPGGVLANATDGELARAIREGVGRDGHPLLIMPSQRFRDLSDEDVAAILGFLRSQPAVTRVVPSRRLGLTPYVILGLHQFPISVGPPIDRPVPPVAPAETPSYGHYLVELATCADCHGEALRGRRGGPGPAAPSILATARASEATFDRALRHGIAGDGHPLNPAAMPWTLFSRFTDTEMRAIRAYVTSLPQ